MYDDEKCNCLRNYEASKNFLQFSHAGYGKEIWLPKEYILTSEKEVVKEMVQQRYRKVKLPWNCKKSLIFHIWKSREL